MLRMSIKIKMRMNDQVSHALVEKFIWITIQKVCLYVQFFQNNYTVNDFIIFGTIIQLMFNKVMHKKKVQQSQCSPWWTCVLKFFYLGFNCTLLWDIQLWSYGFWFCTIHSNPGGFYFLCFRYGLTYIGRVFT